LQESDSRGKTALLAPSDIEGSTGDSRVVVAGFICASTAKLPDYKGGYHVRLGIASIHVHKFSGIQAHSSRENTGSGHGSTYAQVRDMSPSPISKAHKYPIDRIDQYYYDL
jgi:hypothetical protein